MNDTAGIFFRKASGWICRPDVRFQNRCGFTLLELVLVMVLLGIAAVMVMPFVGQIFSNLLEGRDLSHRENQAAMALERFVRDIREASIPIAESIEDGKKVLKANGNKIFVIDSGTLFFVDQDETEHVMVRNLAGDSEFLVTSITSGSESYDVVTLKLNILMSSGETYELSASSIPRESL
jgi:prepilin-type N-terminal cleavage/methylation domain-containing protein